MRAAVITFPGSNCDRDMYMALRTILKTEPVKIWYQDTSLPKNLDLVATPGGFSYGDYLRSGAITAREPIMQEVVKFANQGGYVLGVCNGFQILTETGLLPGTLMRNKHLKFSCKQVSLKIANKNTKFTQKYQDTSVIKIPIAHHDGNYFADEATLKSLQENEQIAFYYANASGEIDEAANPNGSVANIAGIFNKNMNVLGMMPHPERAVDALTGSVDGVKLLEGLR